MLPWLSGSVLRYAIVLSLGWLSLAAIVAATSGAVSREPETVSARPFSMLKLDQADPCTNDSISLDAHLSVTPFPRVDVDLLHTDLVVALKGRMQTGPNRTDHPLNIIDHFTYTRALTMGLLDEYEPHLRLVERPSRLDTLLAVRIQPFWDGSAEAVNVVETRITCQ
jgi:hypothetical protein